MFGLKSASYWTQSAATAANWDNHMKTRQELEYFSENESPQTFELKYALSTLVGVCLNFEFNMIARDLSHIINEL